MARLFTPFQQFGDDEGNPLAFGTLEFLFNNTDNQQVTYSDSSLNNVNTNPVVLDGEGRVPDVFGDGVYTVVLKSNGGVLIDRINDVGGDPGSRTAFSDWARNIIYQIPAFVVATNGLYYRNISGGNIGNDPVTSPQFWEEIRFTGTWNQFVSYGIGNFTRSGNGSLWRSLVGGNLNNPPESDNGTNWIPAIEGAKVPEVITANANIANITTVIPHTGGGALTANRENELRDADTYTLPLAANVPVNQTITITQPDRYVANVPLVEVSGSDTITDDNGVDADGRIRFSNIESVRITLTSDGVNNWSL